MERCLHISVQTMCAIYLCGVSSEEGGSNSASSSPLISDCCVDCAVVQYVLCV